MRLDKIAKLPFLLSSFVFLFAFLFGKGRNALQSNNYGDHILFQAEIENLEQTIEDLQSLDERATWEGQQATSRYLQTKIAALGLQPQVQQYEHSGKLWDNIIVNLPGANRPDRYILVLAHYDSKNWTSGEVCPGADDNASGVAALLEIIRLLKKSKHDNTIQMVFFSNEEIGMYGSKYFAKTVRKQQKDIRAIINVDEIGYNGLAGKFSEKVVDILNSPVSTSRKGKMIAKMAYNSITSFYNGRHLFQVVGRQEDQKLISQITGNESNKAFEHVKWIIGEPCL
jgi:hypothetical protein